MDAKILLVFASLLYVSMAHCVDTFTNDTESVTISWRVINNNSVEFTYTSPVQSGQYIGFGFSRSNVGFTLDTISQLSMVNIIYAGVNLTSPTSGEYFVEDRWINSTGMETPQYDMQQDIISSSIGFNGSGIVIVVIWPIVSTDKTQDLDLNQCLYLSWAYGGPVDSFVSPIQFGGVPTNIGVFDRQICLQNCQVTPSSTPSPTPMSTPAPSSAVVCPSGAQFASGSSGFIVMIAAVLTLAFKFMFN